MSHLLLARARRWRHRPAVRWLLVLGLAGLTGLFAARLVDSAAEARHRWGSDRTVVVVARPVAAGAAITAADLDVRTFPVVAIPSTAVEEPPIGRQAVADLFPGEILLAGRVAPEGRHGAAALLPPGTRALAVPRGPGTPPLHVGDTVDVIATFDPFLFEGAAVPGLAPGESGAAVVSGALVVDVSDGSVTIAVAADEVPPVAFAVAQGAVTLALAG